jgi:hypothetical protein
VPQRRVKLSLRCIVRRPVRTQYSSGFSRRDSENSCNFHVATDDVIVCSYCRSAAETFRPALHSLRRHPAAGDATTRPRDGWVITRGLRAFRWHPARKTPRYFKRTQFIGLKRDLLSKHDVPRCEIVSRHEAPPHDWTAVFVLFDNVRRRATLYQIAPSTVATNHLEMPVPIILGALLYRQPISQKSMTSLLGFVDVTGAEPTPRGE